MGISTHNVLNSHVYAQGLGRRQARAAYLAGHDTPKREMMVKLPFQCEVQHYDDPLLIKMLNKRLNSMTTPTTRDLRSQFNIYRIVLKKAGTAVSRNMSATLEIEVDNI